MQLLKGNEAAPLMKIRLGGSMLQSPVLAAHLAVLEHGGQGHFQAGITGCKPTLPRQR
jgi:hypothetical protein